MRRWWAHGPALALLWAAPLAVPQPATAQAPSRWPQFHGPAGTGIAEGTSPAPVEFGQEKALLWTTRLPTGHSSPVIWGDRIFVTGFHPEDKRLETLCLDRKSGGILWRRSVTPKRIEPVHAHSNPAAPTPVTDGKSVFVYFGSYGLVAYDFEGKQRWSRRLPMAKTWFDQGSGTSPILAGDRLVLDVQLDKKSYLLAVRPEDGKTVWKAPKPEFNGGWATPVVWREGDETLVGILNSRRFTAHSLRDGSERWWIGDLPGQTCATPVVGDGVLFLSASGMQGEAAENVTLPPAFDEMVARHDRNQNGRVEIDEIPEKLLVTDRRATGGAGNMSLRQWLGMFAEGKAPPTTYDRAQWDAVVKDSTEFVNSPWMQSHVLAVRVGGRGDVAKSHVQWVESRGVGEVPSPLLYKSRLYTVRNGGIVLSRDSASGKTVFQGRLGAPGAYYASLVAAGDRIYAASDEGMVVVFEAGDTLHVLARNDLQEPVMATPAIVDGAVYVRTLSHLYAFADTAKASREP